MKGIAKALEGIFIACLCIVVLLCTAMLLVQVFCLFTANGALSAWISDFIMPKAGVVAAVMIVCVVVRSYIAKEN